MDNKLPVPLRAPGLICIPVNTQKTPCPGKLFRSTPGTMTSHALLSGEFLARQTYEAQPHGDADPLLGSAEGGGRRAANPRHSQPVVGAREWSGAAHKCTELCGSSHPCNFGCTTLLSGPVERARRIGGIKQLERKYIFMQPRHKTDTTDFQKSSRSQTRAAVHRKTCKTKKAHKLQQKKRRAYTFFPQAVLKEANHGKGFFLSVMVLRGAEA